MKVTETQKVNKYNSIHILCVCVCVCIYIYKLILYYTHTHTRGRIQKHLLSVHNKTYAYSYNWSSLLSRHLHAGTVENYDEICVASIAARINEELPRHKPQALLLDLVYLPLGFNTCFSKFTIHNFKKQTCLDP
jgi:hypothetical protein